MKRSVLVGSVWVIALTSGVFLERHSNPQETQLTFLRVGQGDCAVFQHDGKTILIDAGPANEFSDAGATLITPALKRLGVRTIDLILLSHPDNDHVGGLPALSRRFRIGRVAIPRHFRDKPEVRSLLRHSGIGIDEVLWTEGRLTGSIGSFRMTVVTPIWRPDEPDNDGSEVVRLDNGHASSLFTGDASTREEATLFGDRAFCRAQVLKVAHHGSRFSTCDIWLDTVSPRFAVLSVGRNNRYGHPSKEVVDRLAQHHIQVFRTDKQGDIQFVVGRNGFEPRK